MGIDLSAKFAARVVELESVAELTDASRKKMTLSRL